jgi:hypothetical protein
MVRKRCSRWKGGRGFVLPSPENKKQQRVITIVAPTQKSARMAALGPNGMRCLEQRRKSIYIRFWIHLQYNHPAFGGSPPPPSSPNRTAWPSCKATETLACSGPPQALMMATCTRYFRTSLDRTSQNMLTALLRVIPENLILKKGTRMGPS